MEVFADFIDKQISKLYLWTGLDYVCI